MNTVIKGILSELTAAVSLDYVRDLDIYAASHLNVIPNAVKDHFIAVKDGRVRVRELSCGLVEKTGLVHLAMYVHLGKKEASILGDDSTNRRGVLDFASDVEAVLKDNLLGITGMQAALPAGEEESELFVSEDETSYQRKRITFTYVWEE